MFWSNLFIKYTRQKNSINSLQVNFIFRQCEETNLHDSNIWHQRAADLKLVCGHDRSLEARVGGQRASATS